MRLIWSPASYRDRQRIFQHIASDNVEAAEQFDRRFEALALSLLQFPLKGRRGRLLGTHELIVHPNYILIYRMGTDVVEIVRIIHAAQRWP